MDYQEMKKRQQREEKILFNIRAKESCYTCARRGAKIQDGIGWRYECQAWKTTHILYNQNTEKRELQESSCILWKSKIPSLFDEPESEEDLKYKVAHYHKLVADFYKSQDDLPLCLS